MKSEPGHLVVEKVAGSELPIMIGNERERIARLVPGVMEGAWLRIEVIMPCINGADSKTHVIALSDEEWLRVADWINRNFVKPKNWKP